MRKSIARKATESQSSSVQRGPKPETVKIAGDWKKAVKKSLQKKKPKEGWPK